MKYVKINGKIYHYGCYHVKEFSINKVFEIVSFVGTKKRYSYIDNHRVHINNLKYRIFKNSLECCRCGFIPSFACMDVDHNTRHFRPVPATFHFYGVVNNELRFLTIDHIVPRSKCGSSNIRNLQTMCNKCNWGKGNRYGNRKVKRRK